MQQSYGQRQPKTQTKQANKHWMHTVYHPLDKQSSTYMQRQATCWVRCTHCRDYEAQGESSNYEARGANGSYKAWGASEDYKAQGASGGKYEARMVIFCILAAVNRFSRISWKAESRWGKLESRQRNLESRRRKRKAIEESQKDVGESRKPLKKAESRWRK